MASANENVKELMDQNMPSRVDIGFIQCPQGRLHTVRADKVDGEDPDGEVLDGEDPAKLYGEVIEIGSENVNGFMDENMPSKVDANVIQPWKGMPQVEIFSVRIDSIDGGGPCQLYGKIIVHDVGGILHIYNRGKESCETICLGDTVSLTGPRTRSILVDWRVDWRGLSIDVALDNWDRREISRGSISLNMYNCPNEYDMPLSIKVPGKHGGATVNYAVWREGKQATVEVMVVGCDGDVEEDHRASKVYGHLIACNSNFERHESVLFCMKGKGENSAMKNQKERNLVCKVIPGQQIPLLRSIVALPLDSSLIIKANLKDHNNALFAEDPVIADGTADFPVQLDGTSEKYICGKVEGRKILLQVTWGLVGQTVVKVTLIKRGDLEEGYPVKVYGQLIAGYSSDFKHYERVLFNRKKNGFIQEVRPGKLIPLLRSELTVPRFSDLTIKADLKHNNNSNDDPVIANGTAVFPFGRNTAMVIHGVMGKMIRVKVTWSY